MVELLRLIRVRTLAFAVLTMYAMRLLVIRPVLELNGCKLQMDDFAFALLVMAICCLISAAYVINDYFDIKSDRISGVRNIVIGKSISRQSAIILHSILNAVAVGIGVVLGFILGEWPLGVAFLVVSGLLWFYSFGFKRFFLLGNILVGLLAALIPISVVAYEEPLLLKMNTIICQETGLNVFILWRVCGFAWFIFLNTLMYEINKDIFSVEGDKDNGFNTIPVKAGIKVARCMITLLAVVAIISLGIAFQSECKGSNLFILYGGVAILLPYIIYIWAVNFKLGNRALQLNLIRYLAVACVGASMFLSNTF